MKSLGCDIHTPIAGSISYTMEDLVDLVDDVDTYGDGEEDVADDEDLWGLQQRVGKIRSGKGWRQLSCIDIQILEKQIRWCAASIRRFE